MAYLYERGKRRRVMHLEAHTIIGRGMFTALCRIPLPFNTTANVPLGRKTCKNCLRVLKESSHD